MKMYQNPQTESVTLDSQTDLMQSIVEASAPGEQLAPGRAGEVID